MTMKDKNVISDNTGLWPDRRNIDGADLMRLIARAQDREDKRKRHLQVVEKPEIKSKTTLGNKIAGLFLSLVGLYIAIHIIVALVRR